LTSFFPGSIIDTYRITYTIIKNKICRLNLFHEAEGKLKNQIKTVIAGCGHIGESALRAVELAPDMVINGIVEVECRLDELRCRYPTTPVVNDFNKLPEKPDVIVLCIPTRLVQEIAVPILQAGIHTVDCFDMHGDPFVTLKETLDPAARSGSSVAVLGAGVDPGLSTLVRALFEIWAPTGLTYVNYGPGMSMGHTVAAKSYTGVRDALSITRPGEPGCHKRDLYLEMEPGADFEAVKNQILADPYFSHDEVRIYQVEDVSPFIDTGHRIRIFRKGGASGVDNQLLTFETTFNNPPSTAQVMVAAARAATRLTPGAYTMLEIPLAAFLIESVPLTMRRLV
jgi:diaminopimelate dehydrogenase